TTRAVGPANRDDAIRRIAADAAYLRGDNQKDPVPYLVLRGLRWGELRASDAVDPTLLEPPSTETRQKIKRSASEGDWGNVIEEAESAMASPSGRGWLD